MLRDFKPVSLLHVLTHEIDRAKFSVIDVHSHVNDAARIDEHMPPERVVEMMEHTNVKTIVILIGLWADKLQSSTRWCNRIPGASWFSRNWIGAR